MVCPNCGNDTFTATLTTRTEYTYTVHNTAGILEESSEVVDGGDLTEACEFICTDCGAEYEYPESELVTQEEYDRDGCCESCGYEDDTGHQPGCDNDPTDTD